MTNSEECWCLNALDSYEKSAEPCDKPCKGRKIEKCGGSISKSVYGLIDIGFNGVVSLRKPTLGSALGSSYNKPSTTIQTTTTTTSLSPFSLVDNKCLNANQLKRFEIVIKMPLK